MKQLDSAHRNKRAQQSLARSQSGFGARLAHCMRRGAQTIDDDDVGHGVSESELGSPGLVLLGLLGSLGAADGGGGPSAAAQEVGRRSYSTGSPHAPSQLSASGAEPPLAGCGLLASMRLGSLLCAAGARLGAAA